MPDLLVWHVGNTNPSITENITSGGAAVDLSASTVQFQMRPVGGTALIVDEPATVTDAAAGEVRYDWDAADMDTAGYYLVWWQVTTGGKTQDVSEALIEIRAHGANPAPAYVELEELKATLEMTGRGFADADMQEALVAASRGIDEVTGRRYYPDTDATQVRYYRVYRDQDIVPVDDLITLTSLQSSALGGATFDYTWTVNTDFVLEPLNAALDGLPYDTIRLHPTGIQRWPYEWPRGLKVTGKFGWSTAPANIKLATKIIATQLVRRTREAPFGVVQFGEEAIRISRFDPQVAFLLAPYARTDALVA